MLFEEVSKIKNILIIFGFIGALTAVWRLSGTIGVICMMIYNTVGIDPLITGGAVLSKFIDYYGKEYKSI